ncbi:MAG: CDP-alcohol phosphatidyltransferase family protein [Planctomycetes bacterium]|nr:CDP-alcohol phosphatidyltransferase family protein [Planctomycetota bacterium]
MSPYEPASRRPIAAPFRRLAKIPVELCVRWNVHPDAISYLSIVAAAAAALCLWQAGKHPWLLLLAPLFCYARLACNMLDGMVALASGKASRRGEIVNELPDRISDALIFAGVAHSGLNAVASGYWAAILALLTAYVGTLGQAVGVQREFSGPMSKPWRMVALHAGAWLALGLEWLGAGPGALGPLTALDWTCLLIVLGCLQTIWIRLARIGSALRRKAKETEGK